jgi:competence ComEA-like helix-hairpin-helix protein
MYFGKNHSMNRKDFLNDYLQFTYKERIAVIALIVIILLLAILPNFFPGASATPALKADTSWMAAANKLLQKKPDTVYYYRRNYDEKEKGFHRQRYTNDYKHAGSYTRYQYTNNYPWRDSSSPKNFYKRPARKIDIIEINSGDTTAFIALPGIGSRLAARIITFRDKLGGFYSVDQVKELYGLPDSTFQLIKPYLTVNAKLVRKININTVTKDELKLHPYIRWQLAAMIIDYRNQHGPFATIDDLKKMQQITEEVFSKIVPYLYL